MDSNKYTRAHNRMAMATGETKTRTKLSKSKHGWLKIAMGITFASTSLFLMSAPTFADDVQPTTTVNQTAAPAQNADQNQSTDNTQAAPTNDEANAVTTPAQPQANSDNTSAADNQAAPTSDNNDATQINNAPSALQLARASQFATYTAAQTQNVRDGASLDSNVVNTLYPGQSVNYDSTVNNDGYEWLHSDDNGNSQYVARLNDDNPDLSGNTSPANQAFISQLVPGAQNTWNEYGVLPSVSLAQAIVESAWGQSAPGNNLYGIKGEYNGQSTMQSTQEYYNGHYVTIQDEFRAYPDYAASIEDHGQFLASNSRYSNLLYSKDYNYVCQMLQADGYATDPNYANTLTGIISYNNLSRYDNTQDQTPAPANNNQSANNDANANTNASAQPAANTDNNGGNDNNQPAQPSSTDGMTAVNGSYTTTVSQNVRTGASLDASVAGTLDPGYTVNYDGILNNDGYNWMHYSNYAGAARWIADINAAQPAAQPSNDNQPSQNNNNDAQPAANTDNNSGNTNSQPAAQPANDATPSKDSAITPASGAYTATTAQNVRIGASIDADAVATLNPGNTIYYDGTIDNDGYTWYHYFNYAGDAHWVADLNDAQPVQQPDNGNNGMDSASGTYTTAGVQNVRSGASLDASVTGTLDPEATIYYDGVMQADGYTWFHYTNFAGQSRWVAQITDAQPVQTPGDTDGMTPATGAYTTAGSQNVRSDAGLDANVTGTLDSEATIYFDGTKQADGYTWLHYTNFSGQSRWIAKLNLAF